MHIECTNGSPMVNTLDHLTLLPLFIHYHFPPTVLDELGMYHALRLHGRIRHIRLSLNHSFLHKSLALMDENFPILESLYLINPYIFDSGHRLPLTLPKAFLAPNLRHLTLFGICLPKRLRVLTSTVSLVTLTLRDIQTTYFRPRLLVARLRSLPLLQELTVTFSISIPRPSAERELLGDQRAPVTLPSLKKLQFEGNGDYLESLSAQIRAPLLDWLELKITLSNLIAFALPHLSHLVNITEALKLPSAVVGFYCTQVYLTVRESRLSVPTSRYLSFHIICEPLNRQICCAAQIFHALIPTLSCVEDLSLAIGYYATPTDMRNSAINSATWRDLLRPFIGMQRLNITATFSEELSRALQMDEVGSDPGFLPNLRSIRVPSIHERRNLFTSFIDTRQAVGRPVQFELL